MTTERKKIEKLTKFFGFLILILLVCQLLASQRLAISGKQLLELELQAKDISSRNQLLSYQVNLQGSLTEIEKRARELGFRTIDNVWQVSSPVPLAYGFGE